MKSGKISDKDVRREILQILKDKKIHQKDELVKEIARVLEIDYQTWIKKENQTKGKQRYSWERRIVRCLSQLNKNELIIHAKDNDDKIRKTYFLITKCGIGAISLL